MLDHLCLFSVFVTFLQIVFNPFLLSLFVKNSPPFNLLFLLRSFCYVYLIFCFFQFSLITEMTFIYNSFLISVSSFLSFSDSDLYCSLMCYLIFLTSLALFEIAHYSFELYICLNFFLNKPFWCTFIGGIMMLFILFLSCLWNSTLILSCQSFLFKISLPKYV